MSHIVIIDDSRVALRLAKKALEGAGHTVQTMEDPGDFDPHEGIPPNLLLVDINMPQFYGDDVVAYIRAEWSLAAPILLFSNVPEDELKERAENCGADGYISKNWGLDILVTKVNGLLGAGG